MYLFELERNRKPPLGKTSITVVQSDLSDGEKWCNLCDLVK